MAQTLLERGIVTIYETGFFDYALPFMVTFAILYGILQRTMFFGKQNEKLNPVFALIVSLMILPFVSKVDYITYASKIVIIMVKFIALAMVLGLLGFKLEEGRKYSVPLAFAAVLVVLATEFFDIFTIRNIFLLREDVMYVLLIILVFGLVVWLITGPTKKEREITREPRGVTRAIEGPPTPEAPPGYDIKKVKRIPGEELEKSGRRFGK